MNQAIYVSGVMLGLVLGTWVGDWLYVLAIANFSLFWIILDLWFDKKYGDRN